MVNSEHVVLSGKNAEELVKIITNIDVPLTLAFPGNTSQVEIAQIFDRLLKLEHFPPAMTLKLTPFSELGGIDSLASFLAACPKNMTVILDLERLRLVASSIKQLAGIIASGKLPHYFCVKINDNWGGDEGAEYFSKALRSPNIKSQITLNYQRNLLTCRGMAAFLDLIKGGQAPSYLTLHLSTVAVDFQVILDAVNHPLAPLGLTLQVDLFSPMPVHFHDELNKALQANQVKHQRQLNASAMACLLIMKGWQEGNILYSLPIEILFKIFTYLFPPQFQKIGTEKLTAYVFTKNIIHFFNQLVVSPVEQNKNHKTRVLC